MSSKLICRFCKGEHLSMKCPSRKKPTKNTTKNTTNKNDRNNNSFKNKKIIITIEPLPTDVYKKELATLLKQWGPIGNIKLKTNIDGFNIATIEFLNYTNGLKALYQLDNTSFEHQKISVKEFKYKAF